MIGHETRQTLGSEALSRFRVLQTEAVTTVTARLCESHSPYLEPHGESGRETCREDLAFLLEFLRPVLEFGFLQPLVDYLCWAAGILESRNIPERYLTESLDWLGEFFAERMAHSDGAFVATTLLAARTAFTAADHAQHTPPKSPLPWPEAAAFEAALLGGNQSEALAVVNRCIEAGNTLVAIELHVIQPALYRIGEQWQSNRVTVAQEHLATAIAQSVMTVAFMRSSPVAPIGKQVLLACVEGNNHALGLRMVADAFHFGGWDTQYLGANMPTSAIVQQVEQCKPDLVALSVAFPQQLQTVKRLMQALDERFGNARPAVIVGGLAINRFNTIANSLGADVLGADAEDAVVAANRIIVSDHIS